MLSNSFGNNKTVKVFVITALTILSLINTYCQPRKLPVFGEAVTVKALVDGKLVQTVQYPVIPAFSFQNQSGETVTEKTLNGKVYVADFFYTNCPDICRIMKQNMLKVYETFKENPEVNIVSHTIDPVTDNVKVLQNYSKKLGVSGGMWHFVTGDYEKISEIGKKHYLLNMQQDSSDSGVHICSFILVDKQKHIRGFYDGTDEREVSQLVRDIDTLLEE